MFFCRFCDLQKLPQLQERRPIEQHNGQHKRKLKPRQAEKKSLCDFSRAGGATSVFASDGHCDAQMGDFLEKWSDFCKLQTS